MEPLPEAGGGALAHLRSRVTARREGSEYREEVLDRRFVAVIA